MINHGSNKGDVEVPARELWLPRKLKISTALDANPHLVAQAVLWALCIKANLPESRYVAEIVLIGDHSKSLRNWILRQGIQCVERKMPVPRSPHCNRIACFEDGEPFDFVVATDCDVYFVADPVDLLVKSDGIYAAPNNGANPPRDYFRNLLAAQGLNRRYRPMVTPVYRAGSIRETHINNISAGVIALPGSAASHFGANWVYWANWLCDRRDMLGPWSIHIDQVSFALNCEAAGLDVSPLPPQANLVLHLLEQVETVYALHISQNHIGAYPDWFGADGTLIVPNGKGDVPDALQRLNSCRKDLQAAFDEIKLDQSSIHSFFKQGSIAS